MGTDNIGINRIPGSSASTSPGLVGPLATNSQCPYTGQVAGGSTFLPNLRTINGHPNGIIIECPPGVDIDAFASRIANIPGIAWATPAQGESEIMAAISQGALMTPEGLMNNINKAMQEAMK